MAITGLEILNNSFFGFWYILGEYFLILLAFGEIITLFFGLYYLIIKR